MPKFESLSFRFLGQHGTLIAAIDRPEALNALNATVLASIEMLLDWIEGRPGRAPAPISGVDRESVRVLILTGAGEKAFVAGADIRQFENMTEVDAAEFATHGHGLLSRLERLPIPVIAAVNGFALGGGLELALACDFIVASENARLGLPESTLGIMPGFGGTVRLPRRIGPAKARELALTGKPITAAEALEFGLVNHVVPQAELLTKALEISVVIAERAPLAIAAVKRSIHEGMNVDEAEASLLEIRLFGELFESEDRKEGVQAFLHKRKPVFQGR